MSGRFVVDYRTGEHLPGRPTVALVRASEAATSGVAAYRTRGGWWHLLGPRGIVHRGITARAVVWIAV